MTFGVIDALEAAGKKMGTGGDVIVISFDAVKDALTVMQDEKIMADFECNPLTAPLVEQTIRHMENGEEVDKVQYVGEGILITRWSEINPERQILLDNRESVYIASFGFIFV